MPHNAPIAHREGLWGIYLFFVIAGQSNGICSPRYATVFA